MPLHTRRQVLEAVEKLRMYEAKRNHVEAVISRIRGELLDYFDRTNRISFVDADGNIWRRQQSSSTIYDDEALAALLTRKNIPIETVYHEEKRVIRDETKIKELLVGNQISPEDLEACFSISYSNPYIRKFPPRGSSVGNGPSTDSGS